MNFDFNNWSRSKKVLEEFLRQAKDLKLTSLYQEMPWDLRDQFNEDIGRCIQMLKVYGETQEASNLWRDNENG